ncbi:MAG TPA: lysylphosphatidylglycerol synthase domain-containing protein [Rhizomicrobium sp.]|jgi:putative membrane protein|nr:lysylphosphatidylglycerol synthase domain-containing protein [Rhizomicrobium sp.]
MKPIALAAFLIGAAILILLVVYAGLPVLIEALAALGLTGLLLIGGAHLPVAALLGTAWWIIGRGLKRPDLPRFIWARAVRDASAESLPFSQVGGYVIGVRVLVLSGASAEWAGTSTLLDLILELVAKVPYILLGLALLALLKPHFAGVSAAIGLTICIIAILIALQQKSPGWMTRATTRLFNRWPSLARLHREALTAFREMTARRAAVRSSLFVHFVCWILGAAETWLIFWLMRRPVGLAPALVIDSLVGALRAVSFFVPAALGIQEGGYVLLCGLFGLSPAAALAFSLARRARDLLLAGIVLPYWQWLEGRALPLRFKS